MPFEIPNPEDQKLKQAVKRELAEQAQMTPEQREAERRAHMQEMIEGGNPKLTPEEQKAHEETERLKRMQQGAK